MNVVFWLIIIIAIVLVWFCLSFTYKGVGSIGLKLFNDAKDEITGKNVNQETKEKDKYER